MSVLLSTDFLCEPLTLNWRVETASCAGTMTRANQDRVSIHEELSLFTLADGLSGRSCGEVAAEMVTKQLPEHLQQAREFGPLENPAQQFKTALEATSKDVKDDVRPHSSCRMGATAVALWLTRGQAIVTHLGDSRAYLLRHDILRRLTCDHSLAELLVESGDLPLDAFRTSPLAHRLTRFCGMEGEPIADVCTLQIEPGDRFLLCSDGLSRCLDDSTLRLLCQGQNPAQTLIDAAQLAKSRDDATALVVQIGQGGVSRWG